MANCGTLLDLNVGEVVVEDNTTGHILWQLCVYPGSHCFARCGSYYVVACGAEGDVVDHVMGVHSPGRPTQN